MKITVTSKSNGVLMCDQVASLKVADILVKRYKKQDNRFCLVRVVCNEKQGELLPQTFRQINCKNNQAIYELAV